jgi:Family of unknown function (DUF6064)
VSPPFTIEQFLGVFVAYNAAIWPTQIAAYCLGLVAIAALWLSGARASRLILMILALMWAQNGIGYQFLFFSVINPAANLFAGLFILQALLFALAMFSGPRIVFEPRGNFRSFAGFAFITYAMLIYPVLGVWAGHGFIAGPMFGVAPCPTTIFTIGMLLLARGTWTIWLSIIPLLWSLIGLAAALQLGILEDLGLAVAGAVLMAVLSAELFRARAHGETVTPATGSAKG